MCHTCVKMFTFVTKLAQNVLRHVKTIELSGSTSRPSILEYVRIFVPNLQKLPQGFLKIVFMGGRWWGGGAGTGRQCTNIASGDSCHQRRAIRRNNIPSWIQVKHFARTMWLVGNRVQAPQRQRHFWLDVPFVIRSILTNHCHASKWDANGKGERTVDKFQG